MYETHLKNGLKVILLENHKAPVVSFHVWYRVGARNEPCGKTGISHLLEHMMFKGTDKIGPEEYSRIIHENGGKDNAFTSNDYTGYFTNISSDRIHIPIELESDRMSNLKLKEEDFVTEKMVVMEERRLRTEDNPQAVLIEQLEATAFQVHPYRFPIIGLMEDLKGMELDDLRGYYKTYYNPSNAFIVAVGDFNREELLSKIEKAFGSIEKGIPPKEKITPEPPQLGERRVHVKKEANLFFIAFGYHVPNMLDPDAYVLEIIDAILSRGTSSRLYQRLVREKRLALSVGSDYPLLSKDPSLFYITAEVMPGKEPMDVEKALNEEIERIKSEPVSDEELEKTKNQLEASFIFAQDSMFYQAMLLARYEIVSNWRKIDDYVPSIRKVTKSDIMRVAKKYLTPDNRTIAVLIPLEKKMERKGFESGREDNKGRSIR
ncbi:MAG: insulinase family protein [Syntrophorhabdaceae bacterium]|nr:insulinase family protein [Syntrophorhabdaceae bacterium]